jgi:membrane protease YdiL (CAAX protease family)
MSTDSTGTPTAPERNEMADRTRSYITWNLADLGIGLFGTLLLIFILATISQVLVTNHYGDETPEAYFGSFVATIAWDIGFVALVLWLVGRKGAGLRNLGIRSPVTTSGTTALWVLGGYVMLYGTVVVYNVLVEVLGLDFLKPSEQLPDNVFDNNLVVVGILVTVVAPIAEEIFFRGFLYGGLTRYLPLPVAGLASGFIFSLAHANVGLIIPFALVGAILAFLYSKTNSLCTNIAVHMLFNLTSVSILVFFPDMR